MNDWHRPTPPASTRGRTTGATTALVAALALTLIAGAPSPARADEPTGNPGPAVTLPFSNRLFPEPTTGGPGTDALNDLVTQECNEGLPLTDREWFTLPSEGDGQLVVRVKRDLWYGSARTPDRTPVGWAVVDHGSAEVISCGDNGPVELEEGPTRSVVAWSDAATVENCIPDDACSLEPLEVFLTWTDGPPANDRWQDATVIGAVPYQDTVDTTLADSDGPTLTPYCQFSNIDPADVQTAWWRFTPTVSGALPLSVAAVDTYGPPGNQPVFTPDVAIGTLTDSGPEPLPRPSEEDCDNPKLVEVEAGTTYLISVHDYIDAYYDSSLVHGGRATLSVGALRPTPPVEVTATPGNRSVTLSWSPPEHPGSSSITGYRIVRYDVFNDSVTFEVPAGTTTYTVDELVNGSGYSFVVTALNAAGPGNPAPAVEATPDGASRFPGPPTDVQVEVDPAARTATLTWSPPESSGAGPITKYVVWRSGSGLPGDGTVVEDLPASARSYTLTGLLPATEYTVRLYAFNEEGEGEPAVREVYFEADEEPPSAPTSVQAAQGPTTGDRGTATLTWQPPASDGGSPITGYRVARDGRDIGGAGPWSTTLPASARSHTFTHLNIWDTYTLSVEAITASGTGPAATGAVTIEDPRPSAPTSVAATAGNASAKVTWKPPKHGDQPVTGYRIRTYVGPNTTASSSTTVGAAARSHTVTGLTNGTSYRFDVTAINAAGTGRASDRSAAVTPATVPGAPKIGAAADGTPGGAITATATWSPPSSTGGSPITGYKVTALRVNPQGKVLQTTVSAVQPASARSLSMTLPKPGTYRFTVQAVNAVGTGPASAQSNTVHGR